MKRILLIVPAYNEESNIEELVKVLYDAKVEHCLVDALIVNDCSTDSTRLKCLQLKVNMVDLPCNLGIGGAVQTGYKYAEKYDYDIAIQVDGDGQHDPSYIEALVQPLLEDEADLIIGSRYIAKTGFQSSFARRVGINYFSKLLYLLSRQIVTDPTSGFRAANKEVIRLFADRYPADYPEPESIMFLKRRNYRIKEVSVMMKERGGGQSSITSFKSIYYMLKVSLAILIDRMRNQTV